MAFLLYKRAQMGSMPAKAELQALLEVLRSVSIKEPNQKRERLAWVLDDLEQKFRGLEQASPGTPSSSSDLKYYISQAISWIGGVCVTLLIPVIWRKCRSRWCTRAPYTTDPLGVPIYIEEDPRSISARAKVFLPKWRLSEWIFFFILIIYNFFFVSSYYIQIFFS